jgi:hypothetical protein
VDSCSSPEVCAGVQRIDEDLKVKLVALQPLWTSKDKEPEGIEKELAAARHLLDKCEDPESTELMKNDTA